MFKKKKEKNKIVLPLYKTHPVEESENGDEEDMDKAVKMAKKWLEEHEL